jgi:hypothetical protein
MPTTPVSIVECRALLGEVATGKTDEEVATWRDELTVVANQVYDHLQARLRKECKTVEGDEEEQLESFPAATAEQSHRDGLERIRWIAYAHENTDDGDAQ